MYVIRFMLDGKQREVLVQDNARNYRPAFSREADVETRAAQAVWDELKRFEPITRVLSPRPHR